MKVVKFLEQEWVLRVFGVGLICSPFINTLVNVLSLPIASQDKWTWVVMSHVWLSGILFQKILNIASIVIGFSLLSGSVKAWRFVLILLGGYILMQLMYLGKDLRQNPMSGFLFLANIGIFLFIADQLVWKQKTTAPAKIEPVAPNIQKSKNKMKVNFKNFGLWGDLVSVSTKGFEIKSLGSIPPQIDSREIQLALDGNTQMRAKFVHRHGEHFYFEYVGLLPVQKMKLQQWFQRRSS